MVCDDTWCAGYGRHEYDPDECPLHTWPPARERADMIDQPTMTCPRCGAEHPDCDGFGFIAHTKLAYPDGCGWCSHPSRDGDGHGNMVCGICGDVRVDEAPPLRPIRGETTE